MTPPRRSPEDTSAPKQESERIPPESSPTPPPAGAGLFVEGATGPTPATPDPGDPEPGWLPPLSQSGPAGPGGPGPAGGSSPRSTAKVRKRDLRDMAAAAVQTAGGLAHTILTRPETPERSAGLWLPDPDDVDNISDPLAGLASRRVPAGAENPDAGDLFRLALGVLGYLAKQVALRGELDPAPRRRGGLLDRIRNRGRGPVDSDQPDQPDSEPAPAPDPETPDRAAAVSSMLGRRSGFGPDPVGLDTPDRPAADQ